jgi:predicted nucleic acid-binding protein
MIYTLDTNVLVYAADASFPLHDTARTVRDHAAGEHRKVRLCYSVLLEFFAVVTDSRRVGNPLPPAEAWHEVVTYLKAFEVLSPDEGTFAQLGKLVGRYQITRQTIFDALIVSMMIQHGVKGIYTDNRRDFARFDEVEVLPWPSADTRASTAT